MKDYLNIFIDKDYPFFIDKYLNTQTLNRLKKITQFCGCDYTKLYSPRFKFTRFDHSLVVAHMTWHFTHDKKSTIAALLHDIGTPCFAHTIDCLLGDALNQESSEINIIKLIKKDKILVNYLKEDNITLKDLKDLTKYPILENKSPKLCTDRLDGVLHTCYIWLHTHKLKDIKKVYDNLEILVNEDNSQELGFTNEEIAKEFVKMVNIFSQELQSNKDKFVLQYISDSIKELFNKKIISLEDLYKKSEITIVNILKKHIPSWKYFNKAEFVLESQEKPSSYYVSFNIKKKTVIPLIQINNKIKRVNNLSEDIKEIYNKIDNIKNMKYAYIKDIKTI